MSRLRAFFANGAVQTGLAVLAMAALGAVMRVAFLLATR